MSAFTITRRQVVTNHALPQEWHPVLVRVLAARGVLSLSDLDTSLDGLHRTDSLRGITEATTLLASALAAQKSIVIVADFDADGATSCALATRALTAMGASRVNYIVPNRFEYGYGLTPPIVELAQAHEPDLLVTVDNGISSIEGVAAARAAGIDVLITDHHLPGLELPAANAIVNPNVRDDLFPSKALAGVGVIFYVMLALRECLRQRNWFEEKGIAFPNLGSLLDLVALGTVADVVPLDQNNRRLVAQGIARIRAGKAQPGVMALLKVAGREIKRLTAQDLAFAVAPRLNAAGRLADMSLGIDCLTNDDAVACDRMSIELDNLNRERREIEAEMKADAISIVEQMRLDDGEMLRFGVCLYDEQWHQGVVGIIASRIKEQCHRPVIAFAPGDDDQLKGSGRSVAGIHLRDVLDAVAARNPGLLSKFGGHAMAAGLSLARENFTRFERAFDDEVRVQLGGAEPSAEVMTDGELDDGDFDLALAEQLKSAATWGQQFPEPLFDGEFEILDKRVVGESHIRLRLRPIQGERNINAIAFGALEEPWVRGGNVIRAAYRLSVNEYRGQRSLQLIVEKALAVSEN